MGDKPRVAVIGVGNMGRHHARVYSELESTKLVAVADKNKDALGKELPRDTTASIIRIIEQCLISRRLMLRRSACLFIYTKMSLLPVSNRE